MTTTYTHIGDLAKEAWPPDKGILVVPPPRWDLYLLVARRTALEHRPLRAELDGHASYAEKFHFPGLW